MKMLNHSSRRIGALLTISGVAASLFVAPLGAGAATKHHKHAKKHASASAGIPAVAHATSLKSEPSIHGSSGKAPTTLLTKDLVIGTGTVATTTSSVEVKYVGASWQTGKDFTAQPWKDGTPVTFPLTTVVPGFAQGVAGMKVGGRREIVIPPALGYGSSGAGAAIKPNETIVFIVDLIAIKK